MTATPWLARYTATEGTARAAWLQHVLDVDLVPWSPSGALALSSRWSVATDGKLLLAVQDDGEAAWDNADHTSFTDQEAAAQCDRGRKAIRGLLAKHPPAVSFRCPVSWLPLWCEQVTWTGCEDCDGDGYGCAYCQYLGRILPAGELRPGLVAGTLVNRNVLAWALAPELLDRGGEVAVGAWHGEPFDRADPQVMIHVCGEGWWLVMMGLNTTYLPPGPHPTFYANDTYLGLWLSRSCRDGRLILADFLEERDDPYAAVLRGEAS